MKKFLLILILILYLNSYSQSASKVNNAQNVWTVNHDPAVLLECDPILSGLFKPRIKDSIYWETYNINGLEDYIKGVGDIRFKPISYTPTYGEIIASLGFTPYNSTNPAGYISSFTEVDPIWLSVAGNYRTKVQNDLLYQPIGSYLISEVDPTVPSYSKTLTAFSVIKSSTDPLYKVIGYTPSNAEVISALGFTPYNSTNPNVYINQAGARTAISLTTTGTGIATYNNSTGVLNVPTPEFNDYTNNDIVAGGAGNVVFYITNDKTSTGTALYTNITFVGAVVNDSTTNYSSGWSYNSGTKALTVNTKAAVGLNVALVGLTLLGVPSNVANGTRVYVLVKGN